MGAADHAAVAAPVAAKATLIVQVTKRDDSIRCVRAPCWVPAAGVKVTIVRDDQVVARRVSGKDGRFRIELDAGAYLLRAPYLVSLPKRGERRVVLRSGQVHRVTLNLARQLGTEPKPGGPPA